MGEQLLARAIVKGQLVNLPEELQFEIVRQTMELMIHKKLLEEQKVRLQQELKRQCFVFQETPAIPFKNKKKLQEEALYVSTSRGEFWARVLRKVCSKGLSCMIFLMAMKFLAACFDIDALKKAGDFVSGHFFLAVGGILAGCAVLSTTEVSHKDRRNALKLKKLNNKIAIYNKDIDDQNFVIRQKNQQIQEADKKRRVTEEQIYQAKRREQEKLLQACEKAYQKVVTDLELLQERNVVPGMFFEEGNKFLPLVYYLMQNRITAKLYGLDGALEKARSMLHEEEMSNKVQQIVDHIAQTVGQLNLLNSKTQEICKKLDSLGCQMQDLEKSQKRINATLAEVCESNQKAVAAIASQKKNSRSSKEK